MAEKISKKQLIANIEKAVAQAIFNGDIVVDLTREIELLRAGNFKIRSRDSLLKLGNIKDMKQTTTIKIESLVKTNKLALNQALGRFFEYQVYECFRRKFRDDFDGEETGETVPIPSLSFLLQKYMPSKNKGRHTDQMLREAEINCAAIAQEAVNIYLEIYAEKIGDKIKSIKVLAGSDELGDLVLNGIVLELKYYKDTSKITFSTKTDSAYGFASFVNEAKKTNSAWKIRNNKKGRWAYVGVADWYSKLVSDVFYEYAEEELGKKTGTGNGKEWMTYLLSKGDQSASNLLLTKKLIIGHNIVKDGDKVRVEITADLQSLLNQFRDINVIHGDQGLIFESPSESAGKQLAAFNLQKEQFERYSGNTDKYKKERDAWTNGTRGTLFSFILNRSFFAPNSQ